MKRFWKTASVITQGEAHAVELDGRPVKLPSGNLLIIPFQSLAKAIALEWTQAPTSFSPEDLPLTRLASTAQERIPQHRGDIIRQLAAYGMNDLLCYRAEIPAELAARQDQIWGPWLSWAERAHGLNLLITAGIIPITQPPGTNERLEAVLGAESDYTLAALGVIVPALGSLLLGLALRAKALSPEDASDIAALDELWQEEQWGTEDEAATRRAKITSDVSISTQFMRLCAT